MRAVFAAFLAHCLAWQSGSAIGQQDLPTWTLADGTSVAGKVLYVREQTVFLETAEGISELPLARFGDADRARISETFDFPTDTGFGALRAKMIDGAVVFNPNRQYASRNWQEIDEQALDIKFVADYQATLARVERGGRVWLYRDMDKVLVPLTLRRLHYVGHANIRSDLASANMKDMFEEVKAICNSLEREKSANSLAHLKAQPPAERQGVGVVGDPAKTIPPGPRQYPGNVNPDQPPTNGPSRKMDTLDVATIVMYTAPGVLIAFLAFWIGRAIRDGM